MNRVKWGSGWEHLLEIARLEGLDRAYTWNPAVGCGNTECEVRKRGKCWAMMMARRFGWSFEPHLIPERLDEPFKLKTPSVITPVSMGDIFDLDVKDVAKILDVVWKCDRHVFALLSKLRNDAYALLFDPYPDHVWFGVSVNCQDDVWRLDILREVEAKRKYCLFEPLYGPIKYDLSWLDLIVIGPQNYPTVQPKKRWVESIVRNAKGARIFFKSKLDPRLIPKGGVSS